MLSLFFPFYFAPTQLLNIALKLETVVGCAPVCVLPFLKVHIAGELLNDSLSISAAFDT